MNVSVVIETWNIDELGPLRALLTRLAPQLGAAELVITHAGIAPSFRPALDALAGKAASWVELSPDDGYYEHKNRGFAASRGDIVAFVDGDCAPCATWLAELIAPITLRHARVVAGHTTYGGPFARVANELDFPYFTDDRARGTVRNFFANNVAFAREVFAVHSYPAIARMFHGQCQVLGMELRTAGIAIHHARAAHAIHAWPRGARAWLHTRLLKGADTATLLPYVLAHYAPRAPQLAASRASALAVLAARAITGAARALRQGPRLRNLALVAGVTVVDALGAVAAPLVYRALSGTGRRVTDP